MTMLLGGCAVLAGASFFLAAVMPRGDRVSRFVGTVLEPYLALAVTAGFSIALAMILSGAVALLGG
jgi:hypothetical protein